METQRARRDGAFEHRLRSLRRSSPEDRGLGLAVEDLAADTLARLRCSGDGLKRIPALAYVVSRSRQPGERHRPDACARGFGAARGARDEEAQQRLEPVMARVMDVIRLRSRRAARGQREARTDAKKDERPVRKVRST